MRQPLLALLFGAWLIGPASGAGFSARDDRAKLFSSTAIQEAATAIDELREQYHKDLRIETFAKVPLTRDPLGTVKKMDDAARERFFTHWAVMDARKAYMDGVFVLICKEPLEVRVVVQFRGSSHPIT